MVRCSKKSRIFMSAKRKKKVVNLGLLKWRQQRHTNRLDIDRNPIPEQIQLQHGSGISKDSFAEEEFEPLQIDRGPVAEQIQPEHVRESTKDSFSEEDFEPGCSSTPFVSRSRKRLTFNLGLNKSPSDDMFLNSSVNNMDGVHSLEADDEEEDAPIEVVGRRIVDFSSFFEDIKHISDHNNAMGCTIVNMNCIKETRFGLKSIITLKCNMCNLVCKLSTEKKGDDVMDINTASVAGAMAIGIGHSQLEELFSAIEVPAMSVKTYSKYHHQVSDGWEAAALKEMEMAANEEKEHAIDEGRVTPDGTPILTVVADGSWSKRSYRTNYNALSGVAAIVGAHTKKVLFLGVRNKYCTTCVRAEAKATPVTEHKCYKNWNGSSTSMEADIIVEGFQRSIEMYNVVYGTILADGDSNVYSLILDSRPYPNWTVDKIECTNHLLRNYCTKLRDIVSDTKSGPIEMRKVLSSNILRLRTAVTKAAQYRRQESDKGSSSRQIMLLQQDLTNSASHVFGEHSRCKELQYFCKGPKDREKNHVPDLKKCGIFQKIMRNISYLTDNARSLILQDNNNPVEHFNSIVAKVVGGKRVNFSKSRSYEARCSAAVVSHNTRLPLYSLHKSMYKNSPRKVLKSLQQRRAEKVRKAAKKRKLTVFKKRKQKKTTTLEIKESRKSYGPLSQKPDMAPDVFERKKKDFVKGLRRTEEEREELEKATMKQAESGMWKEERRKLLTASNFGTVCKRRRHTSCANLVKALLYTDVDCPAMKYGRGNEINAISWLEDTYSLTVNKCGLFIDRDIPYLGATPDGLVGQDAIVEVKCPESCKSLTPEEAIIKKKFTFWTVNQEGEIGCVNKNHNYFYQVQGQLHVTNRIYCFFVMWTPLGARVEIINRDNTFWLEQMAEPLSRFYIDCLLPELIDPRHTRSMPIRNPEYIKEAMRNMKTR